MKKSPKKRIGIERIKVYIDYENGRTVCICRRENKRCDKQCTPDVVERDKYRDWQKTFAQDRYGKSKI